MMKIKTISIFLGTAALALVGCSQNSEHNAEKLSLKSTHANTMVISNDTSPPTLDPGKSQDSSSQRVIRDLFEGLVSLDQRNLVVPGVAKSWTVSKDELVYTFNLQKKAKWSNGKPVTAQDFVFAFQRNIDPKTAATQTVFFLPIKNAEAIISGKLSPKELAVKALSNHQLQITLKSPSAVFLQNLSTPITFPLYKPALEKWGDKWSQQDHIVSNGAYNLKKWIINGYLLEEKNPYYWDAENVKIPFIKILPTNATTAYSLYEAGDADYVGAPSGTSLKVLKEKYKGQVYNVPYIAIIYYWFNLRKPEFQDVRVRKALNMVINRVSLAKNVIKLGRKPAYGVAPDSIQQGEFKDLYKQLPSYDWVGWSKEKRMNEAKKLLTAAGYTAEHPLVFQLSYNTRDDNKKIALTVQQMWAEAFGNAVQAKLTNSEWKVYLQKVNKGDYDVARMGSNASINAVGEFVHDLTCNAPGNSGGGCIKAIGDNYKLATATSDLTQYNLYMKKALKIAMNQYLRIPIYNAAYTTLLKPRIGGYHPKDNNLAIDYSKWFYIKK